MQFLLKEFDVSSKKPQIPKQKSLPDNYTLQQTTVKLKQIMISSKS